MVGLGLSQKRPLVVFCTHHFVYGSAGELGEAPLVVLASIICGPVLTSVVFAPTILWTVPLGHWVKRRLLCLHPSFVDGSDVGCVCTHHFVGQFISDIG